MGLIMERLSGGKNSLKKSKLWEKNGRMLLWSNLGIQGSSYSSHRPILSDVTAWNLDWSTFDEIGQLYNCMHGLVRAPWEGSRLPHFSLILIPFQEV
jgi:hypothetical protein